MCAWLGCQVLTASKFSSVVCHWFMGLSFIYGSCFFGFIICAIDFSRLKINLVHAHTTPFFRTQGLVSNSESFNFVMLFMLPRILHNFGLKFHILFCARRNFLYVVKNNCVLLTRRSIKINDISTTYK